MNNATVAQTIAQQLGNGTLAMLGAKNLLSDYTSLSFKISGSKKCTNIKIALEANDTYTVTFYKITKRNYQFNIQEESVEMVYADSLHRTIEAHTELRTKL
jgi:hypothetical protein